MFGEERGVVTDTEEEAQDANPQDMDNPQDLDKEEQQEDSVDTVTKAFGTMTTGSTAPATKECFLHGFCISIHYV